MNLAIKPKLLLLSGWGVSHAIWQPFIQSAASAYDCQPMSLPIYEDATCQHFFDNINAMHQTAEDIGQPVHILAWSLGGRLACELAVAHPDVVKSIVLVGVNPCFVADAANPHGMPVAVYNSFVKSVDSQPARAWRRFLSLVADGECHQKACVRDWLSKLSCPDASSLQASLRWLEADWFDLLSTVQAPKFALYGNQDALVGAKVSQRMSQHCMGVSLIEQAGHAWFYQQPETLLAYVQAFHYGLGETKSTNTIYEPVTDEVLV